MVVRNRIELSDRKKIRILLEMDQEICSLDPEFNRGTLRRYVYQFSKKYGWTIYRENCNCDNKAKGTLNKDGTPRKHNKYMKDWAS